MPDAHTDSVPILMYHRIATDGPSGLKPWRVAPDLFSAQIKTLHDAGYKTIALTEWTDALIEKRPVEGKRVVLTFDDGYSDFLSAAAPVLSCYDFSATVFLVAERIGQTALWDEEYGPCAPLMSWEEIKSLQEKGIEFGAHSCIHKKMTEMRSPDLAADTVRARAILEKNLGVQVPTLAYPYGAQDESVRIVVGEAGTKVAVTTEDGISKLGDDLLRLPRKDVNDSWTPELFISLMEKS